MQREKKKSVMEEKIQEWLNMKKDQVDHCFKLSNASHSWAYPPKCGQFNCSLSYAFIHLWFSN